MMPAEAKRLTLRDYQSDLLGSVHTQWDGGKFRVIMQLPTGGGKTEIAAAEIAARAAAGESVVMLVHRDNLVEQTVSRLLAYGIPAQPASGKGSVWRPGKERPAGVLVLCLQTYRERLAAGLDPNRDYLLIVDECHWYGAGVGFGLHIAGHKGLMLGLTATPRRTNPKEGYSGLWDTLTLGPTVRELIDGGSLCDYAYQPMRMAVQFAVKDGRIKVMRNGKELADVSKPAGLTGDRLHKEKLRQAADAHPELRSTLTDEAVRVWADFDRPGLGKASDRPTIFFAYSIAHAYELQKLVKDQGYAAEVITSKTSVADRSVALAEFRKHGGALINVDILREGFDAPDCGCVVLTRPTDSLAMFLQMVGRGLRPKADGGNLIILDLVDNWKAHGLPDSKRDWRLEPQAAAEDPLEGDNQGFVCGYQVEFVKDKAGKPTGYIVDGKGKSDGDLTLLPVDGGKGGCGAMLAAGAHSCRVCGASRGKECLPYSDDGCGKFRSWKQWEGSYQHYRAGACDSCGHESWRVEQAKEAAERAGDKAQRFSWRVTKRGNGETLRVCLGVTIWAGPSKSGKRYQWKVFTDGPHYARIDAGLQQAMAEMIAEEDGILFPTLNAAKDGCANALLDWLDEEQLDMLVGYLCRDCGVNRHNPKFNTCWDCHNGQSPQGVADMSTPPEDEPPPAADSWQESVSRPAGIPPQSQWTAERNRLFANWPANAQELKDLPESDYKDWLRKSWRRMQAAQAAAQAAD